MINKCKEHLYLVKETYSEHRKHAWWFSGKLIQAAFACFIHGLIPSFFTTTASTIVKNLHEKMSSRLKNN